MGLVEAPGSRVICRECGSAISPGEPRFGRNEGEPDAPRMRWRHLACAAQALPEALLRSLEFGGWRSIPADEHDELRALICKTIAARRTPDRATGDPPAARSSSAIAAAAVLEPAHESASLSPARARAWVYADALQGRGDARGELLALELAAEHTDDPRQARALARAHRALWRSLELGPKPSPALRLRWVGGVLLGAYPKHQRELVRLLASPAAAALARVRLDFCTHEELGLLVAVARAHARLAAVELPHSRVGDLRALAALPALTHLRVGDRFDPRLLAALERLRGLSLAGGEGPGVAQLEPLAGTLEQLELRELANPAKALGLDGLGQALPTLAHLTLAGLRGDGQLEFLRGASSLRSLRLPDSPIRSLAPLSSLANLRELILVPARLHVVDELQALTRVERLALIGSKVGELEPLAALQACEHLALSAASSTKLEPLAALARLRNLALEGGDLRRISGLEALTQVEQLRLAGLANLDLQRLAGFARLHTLVLDPDGRRPRALEQLASLPALRRLSLPVELFDELAAGHRTLAQIDVLELTGEPLPDPRRLARLPRLRRLLLPGRDPAALEQLRDALPSVMPFVDLAPRDCLDRRDRFDWRSLGWPDQRSLPLQRDP